MAMSSAPCIDVDHAPFISRKEDLIIDPFQYGFMDFQHFLSMSGKYYTLPTDWKGRVGQAFISRDEEYMMIMANVQVNGERMYHIGIRHIKTEIENQYSVMRSLVDFLLALYEIGRIDVYDKLNSITHYIRNKDSFKRELFFRRELRLNALDKMLSC